MRWLCRLANEQKLFRRAALVWACTLITWTVYRTFTAAPVITAGTATALATVVGILTVVVGLYQAQRGREDRQ